MHRKGKHRHMQLHYQNIKFKIIALNKNVQLRQSGYIYSQIHICVRYIFVTIYVELDISIYLFTCIHFNCFILSMLHNLSIKGKTTLFRKDPKAFYKVPDRAKFTKWFLCAQH